MAKLLSPFCADTSKLRYSLWSTPPSPGSLWLSHPSIGISSRGVFKIQKLSSPPLVPPKVATTDSISFADDYYAVLGLLPDASPEEIKQAYYTCMKACHPDLAGDDPEITNFCMFINEVYEVLSDPVQRMIYDEIQGYAVTAVNPFFDNSKPKDHVFVDEFSCIGCKNCANVACGVFKIEEDYGRARVHNQFGNRDLVQQAIDSCPVDCIHWASAAQLSLLEDEMRRVERINVAFMLSGMGGSSSDVFRMASTRWERRQSKVLETARMRMEREKGSNKGGSYWSAVVGKQKDYQNFDEEVEERVRRTAAAARRWREYSRRRVDNPPIFSLPEAISDKEK